MPVSPPVCATTPKCINLMFPPRATAIETNLQKQNPFYYEELHNYYRVHSEVCPSMLNTEACVLLMLLSFVCVMIRQVADFSRYLMWRNKIS